MNGRERRTTSAPTHGAAARDINPFPGGTGQYANAWGCSTERRELTLHGVRVLMQHIESGLSVAYPETPSSSLLGGTVIAFIRKLALLGGSDAHGDLNYTTGMLATKYWSSQEITDSAFARARTFSVDGTLDGALEGRAIMTDGPLVELRIDPAARWTVDPGTGQLLAQDDAAETADPERFGYASMGGHGPFQAGGTALFGYANGAWTAPKLRIDLRCASTAATGGAYPSELSLMHAGGVFDQDERAVKTLLKGGCAKAFDLGDWSCTESGPGLDGIECDGDWRSIDVLEPPSRTTAIMAHVATSAACHAYDDFANPTWLGRVHVKPYLGAEPAPKGLAVTAKGKHALVIDFPVSMMDTPVAAHLYGVKGSQPVPLTGGDPTVAHLDYGQWTDRLSPAGLLRNTRLRFKPPPPTSPIRWADNAIHPPPPADVARFILVVTDPSAPDFRLRDHHGTPLGPLIVPIGPFGGSCTHANFDYCPSAGECVLSWECPPNATPWGDPGCACCEWSPFDGCLCFGEQSVFDKYCPDP